MLTSTDGGYVVLTSTDGGCVVLIQMVVYTILTVHLIISEFCQFSLKSPLE